MSLGTPVQNGTKPPLIKPMIPSAIIVAAKAAWPKLAMCIALAPVPFCFIGPVGGISVRGRARRSYWVRAPPQPLGRARPRYRSHARVGADARDYFREYSIG